MTRTRESGRRTTGAWATGQGQRSALVGALAWIALALLAASGCLSDDEGGGSQSSSSTHWLVCDDDSDCRSIAARCGDGVCVDNTGAPVAVEPQPGLTIPATPTRDAGVPGGGTSGGGGMGSSTPPGGTGGTGGGGTDYEPCAAKACGDACTLCAPDDATCVETRDLKTCDSNGVCGGGGGCGTEPGTGVVYPSCGGDAAQGAMCSGRDDQPVPECCGGSGAHLRCEFTLCTASFPATCSGTYAAVTGSDACGGYQPCGGKACGDSCTQCPPGDPACSETAVVKECDAAGQCNAAPADCTEPASCSLTGPDTCADGQVCCAVGRCGPVVRDQGVCEPADPSTRGCMPCACENQPGGCPICNSPDTPILTPEGERPIAELREGDLVMSVVDGELVAVPVLATRQVHVFDHAVVRLVFEHGGAIEVSGSHPTADGRRLDALEVGDRLGDALVVSVELVPYEHDRTHDILPASDSGTYIAGGALLASTLRLP